MQQASVGRIVHVHGRWDGPRPGIVVNGPFGSRMHENGVVYDHVNLNVFLDGLNDQPILAEARSSPLGSTMPSIPLFREPLTLEQHATAVRVGTFAVWPPRVEAIHAASSPPGGSGVSAIEPSHTLAHT